MGIVKWHLLNHVCDDIARIGGLYLNDSSIYECPHKTFKNAYKLTSQWTISSMDDSSSVIERRIPMADEPKEKSSVH